MTITADIPLTTPAEPSGSGPMPTAPRTPKPTPASPAPTAAQPEPSVTDRELLTRFYVSRDEAAFSQLVARHGPLVLAVCRRVLRQSPDVDDAFQATFLALARRAGQIAWQESAAAWLHRVAFRAACRLRADNARKREVEWSEQSMVAADVPDPASEHGPEWDEIAAASAEQALHEEVLRLPSVYRDVIALCCLEGMSREDAARELGTTETVVKGRLQRGRKLLVMQLGLRGLALSAVLAAFQQSVLQAAPAVPPELVASTAAAAAHFAAGNVALLSPTSVSLARGVPQMISQATIASKTGWALGMLSAIGLATALAVGNARAGDGRGVRAAGPQQAVALKSGAASDGVQFQLAQATEVAKATAEATPEAVDRRPAKRAAADAAQAEAALMDTLKKPARLEFIETPLADVVEFLKDEYEMPIGLDKPALEAQGIDVNTPVTANLSGISLRAALRRVLSQNQLCYVVRDEMLVITTKVDAAQDFSPKIYPVADLLDPTNEEAGELQALSELIKAACGTDTWSQPGIPGPPVNPFEPNAGPRSQGTITPHGKNLLVISQSWPVHEQIELFLTELRKHHKKQ